MGSTELLGLQRRTGAVKRRAEWKFESRKLEKVGRKLKVGIFKEIR